MKTKFGRTTHLAARASMAFLFLAGLRAEAQPLSIEEPIISSVVTRHIVSVEGQSVPYSATFTETPITGTMEHPLASMSSTTYLRTDVQNKTARPVMFVFNGGPGASSSPLHLHGLGPRIIQEPDKHHHEQFLADNPYSLLDAADLVFIDPVGTGLSRVFPGGNGHPYWGPDSDAKTVLSFIQQWLKEHQRERSPIYIVGESYGGYRLATMMKLLGDQPVSGLILISPMLNRSQLVEGRGHDQPYINNFPAMAAAAWFHHRVDRRDLSLDQFVAEAEAFASSEYASALQLGQRIPDSVRDVVAEKIASFIGLSVKQVIDAHLRVDSETFLNTLLADQGLRIGRLDTRVTGPLHAEARSGVPTNDPSLVIGQKTGAVDDYFSRELNVTTHRRYIQVAFDINQSWNWVDDKDENQGTRFYFANAPFIGDVMSKQSSARLLLVGGVFDLAAPWFAARYDIAHADMPMERVTEARFDTGHTPYEGEANLQRLSKLLHAFVSR